MDTKDARNVNKHKVNKHIARWVHAWVIAASQIYKIIEATGIPELHATDIGRKDGMAMVLVGAVRNVVRGAESCLGQDSELVRCFDQAHPQLRGLRDRFEHYEDYVVGTGNAQRQGRKRNRKPLELDMTEIEI